MKSIKCALACAASIAVLSACGGADAVKIVDRTLDPTYGTEYKPLALFGTNSWSAEQVADASGNFVWFTNQLNASALSGAVPSTNATYNGSMTITREVPSQGNLSGEIYYARMQMNADFASQTLDGSIGNFGRVNITGIGSNVTNLVSGSGSFAGTISGTAMQGTTVTAIIDGNAATGSMSGDFFKDNDTGRHIVSGFADLKFATGPDGLGTFLASE